MSEATNEGPVTDLYVEDPVARVVEQTARIRKASAHISQVVQIGLAEHALSGQEIPQDERDRLVDIAQNLANTLRHTAGMFNALAEAGIITLETNGGLEVTVGKPTELLALPESTEEADIEVDTQPPAEPVDPAEEQIKIEGESGNPSPNEGLPGEKKNTPEDDQKKEAPKLIKLRFQDREMLPEELGIIHPNQLIILQGIVDGNLSSFTRRDLFSIIDFAPDSVSKGATDQAFQLAMNKLRQRLSEAFGQEIIRKLGKNSTTSYQVNPDFTIQIVHDSEDPADVKKN